MIERGWKSFSLQAFSKASDYALGAALEQSEQPVIFITRKLSKAERGYSQTQKEALAVVWAVKKLHKYLYGSHFTIITAITTKLSSIFSIRRHLSGRRHQLCSRDGRLSYLHIPTILSIVPANVSLKLTSSPASLSPMDRTLKPCFSQILCRSIETYSYKKQR